MQEIIEKINKLKKERNAVVLAHCYQNIEIDEVADYVGDSLGLSISASKTNADVIVFAGVYFMAQSAKILSPAKKILLPNLKSGCQMADMITPQQLEEFKAKNPNIPVVCYVNSTAEVKALCDICCTSANAVDVVRSLGVNKVLFVPDMHLGHYVSTQLSGIEVITYPGYCPTHLKILPEDISNLKRKHPDAKVLAHPECHREVIKLADFTGSTTQIMQYCVDSNNSSFIIATETGVVERLQRDNPHKNFIIASQKAYCPNMKWHTLGDILYALENEEHEINVTEELIEKALSPIQKMINLQKIVH